MSRNDVAVRLEDVTRTYRTPTGEVRALGGVSATLPRGVVSAIVGPSGSGKSSLLRVVAGLDRPTTGSVSVMGVEAGRASSRSRRALRRSTVGYVFQRPSDNLLPHLTVAEHLRLAGRGRDGAELGEIARALGIGHRMNHRPGELSGGEQQRVAVAEALSSGASIVVADEPTAELDSDAADMVLSRIQALAHRGTTFVLATHDPSVMSIAEHRLALEHGAVAQERPRARSSDTPDPTDLLWPSHDVPGLRDDSLVVAFRGVDKRYGASDDQVRALDGVDVEVMSGEVVGLVGRSGSGKTTLLNIAAGWEVPDGGVVRRPGNDQPQWADVAVVPQHLGLMDELTVRENVEYPARLTGELQHRRGLIEDLLEVLGLARLQRRFPRETSLGEQQRTAVARAVVLGPTLILADEPTAHQDAAWAAAVFRTLAGASVAGSACLVATHDLDVLGAVDRTLRMADGSLTHD